MQKLSAHLLQLLCSILLLGYCQILNAQHLEYHFEHYGNAEGLSYNTVNTLYQDKKGLLWVGTWDGLCTFDGYEFSCRYKNKRQLRKSF